MGTKNPSKCTHSYTAQYTITLDGTLLRKVFLCMQEVNKQFGPRVQERVKQLEEEYGNVYVTCSKSGKLSKSLYQEYLKYVLKPYVLDNEFLYIIDSWTGQTDLSMYDEIFKDQDSLPTCSVKVIPGKCTGMCQPLDVFFYRQLKLFIKRLQNCVVLMEEGRDIDSREDCLKKHSLMGHQLAAREFQDMIRYAWYECGVGDEKPKL